MEEIKGRAIFENSYSKLSAASESIRDIIHDPVGSRRSYTFSINDGLATIDPVGGRFVVIYSLEKDFEEENKYEFTVSGLGFDGNDKDFTISGSGIDTISAHVSFLEEDIEEELLLTENTFQCINPLEGTVRIDLEDTGQDPDVLFGRIFLFDLGLVKHTYSCMIGTYEIILENNNLLFIKPSVESVKREPGVTSEDNLLAFKIIQMRYLEGKATGGNGRLRFSSVLSGNNVHEMFTTVYNVKLQVYGPYAEIWLDYFKQTHDFTEIDPQDGHTLLPPLEGINDEIVVSNFDGDDAIYKAGQPGGLYVKPGSGEPYTFKDLDGDWIYDDGLEPENDAQEPVYFDSNGQANPSQGDQGGLYALEQSF